MRAEDNLEEAYKEAIRDILNEVENIGTADIVAGIRFYNEVSTIGHIFRTVKEGLTSFYPDKRCVIVCAGAPVGERALELINAIPVEEGNIKRIAFLLGDKRISGEGWALRAIIEIAHKLGADLVLFEADLASREREGRIEGIAPNWVQLFLDPIQEEGMELVLPRFTRHYFDAIITNNLVYPLITSIYNLRAHEPIAGELGISRKLLGVYLKEPEIWLTNIGGRGVNIWLKTTAIVNDAKICEANLGVKIHRYSPGKREVAFKEIANTFFERILEDKDWWRGRGNIIHSLGVFGPKEDYQLDKPWLSQRWLVSKYQQGFNRFYYTLYEKILPRHVCEQLEELAKKDLKKFDLSSKLWAQIVYDFLLAFAFNREFARGDILNALIPIYHGRVASFVGRAEELGSRLKDLPPDQVEHLVSLEAERSIQDQVEDFLREKAQFLTKWEQKEIPKPLLPKVAYWEFIPGVPLLLPQEVTPPTGERVEAKPIYEAILERYRREFEEFVHGKLKVPQDATSLEIAQGVGGFMDQVEDYLDRFLPGDLFTVEGARQTVEAIFSYFPRQEVFFVRSEVASRVLWQYPPTNLLTKLGYPSVTELLKDFDANDVLALAVWSEEQEYTKKTHQWIGENARPEHFTYSSIKPLVVSSEDFPSLVEMKEASALSRLVGRVVVSNLPKGRGGKFPKLRYLTTIAKNIVEAERFGEVWRRFAEERREFGRKVVNSIEGHWGRKPFSAHNIFENGHQRILAQRLREMALSHFPQDSCLEDVADSYHLALTLPDGRFIPCSAWTWASYSFKGGRGFPTPLSLHVERDWASREFLMEYFKALGGSEEKAERKIIELMGQGMESEDLSQILLGIQTEEVLLPQILISPRSQAGKLSRFEGNPILEPIKEHPWESKYVFNAGAMQLEGKIYIFYRAVGDEGISRIGLAISSNGFQIDERLAEPIFEPEDEYETCGCEDPRLTIIGDQIYMLYTAYDGIVAQIALASIGVEDSLKHLWKRWRRHGLAFPGFSNKDAILFPETFDGRYTMYHRIEPGMWVSFSDFVGCPWPEEDHKLLVGPRSGMIWDGVKIGAGAQPLKTRYGWLLIYHGVDYASTYRLGVILTALENPSRLLYRSPNPILEPKEAYEVGEVGKSWAPNVVFTCGAVPRSDAKEILDKEDEILVYYGGADTVIGVAIGRISDLIPEEVRHQI